MSRQPRGLRIKRPHAHPVRAYCDGWAALVIGVGIAPLRSACEHVSDTRYLVGRPGFMGFGVGEPLQRSSVCTHGRIRNHLGISRHTGETVAALAQDYSIALRIGVNDSS